MKLSKALGSALFIALTAVASGADSLVITADRDNTMYDDGPNHLSNGAGDYFFCGNNAQTFKRRAGLHFDIAGALPAGSTINSVSLSLRMTMTQSGARDNDLHRLLSDWGEAGSHAGAGEGGGDLAEEGDLTWNYNFYSTTTPTSWGVPGGDFAPIVSASTSVSGIAFYTWSDPNLVADVQFMQDNPAQNFGWILKDKEELGIKKAKRFNSRENINPATRPMLTIDFTPPAALGIHYCVGGMNSVGLSASMDATGSAMVQDNNVLMIASNAPPQKFGLFFFGPSSTQLPLGGGFLCVGSPITRLSPALLTDATGSATRVLDLSSEPALSQIAAVAPVTRYFQFWYRDTGGSMNLTDGLQIDFQ